MPSLFLRWINILSYTVARRAIQSEFPAVRTDGRFNVETRSVQPMNRETATYRARITRIGIFHLALRSARQKTDTRMRRRGRGSVDEFEMSTNYRRVDGINHVMSRRPGLRVRARFRLKL